MSFFELNFFFKTSKPRKIAFWKITIGVIPLLSDAFQGLECYKKETREQAGCVTELVRLGARADVKDTKLGKTPLHYAALLRRFHSFLAMVKSVDRFAAGQ